MGKNVDMFSASKEMSERVAKFMRVKVWGVTLKARLEKSMKDFDVRIDAMKGLEKDTGIDYTEVIEQIKAVAKKAKVDYKKAVEEAESFDYTSADLQLYADYKDGSLVDGIISWCDKYDLVVDENTQLVQDLVKALGGARALGGRAIVRANAEKFTDNTRTKNDVLKVFYGKLAEAMMHAGTLKPEAIPEDVREMYAIKKKKK